MEMMVHTQLVDLQRLQLHRTAPCFPLTSTDSCAMWLELSLGLGGWGGLGSKLGYIVPSATPDKVTSGLIVCQLPI